MNKIQNKYLKFLLLTVLTVMLFSVMSIGAQAADSESENLVGVAQVGDKKYETLTEAFEAAQGGETITLLTDISLSETIKNTKKVTLDLNGKTISQEKACTAHYGMIENKGNLTITGNGKISFKDIGTGDPTFGWGSYTIINSGILVIENGTIENLSAQNQGNGQPNVHMYCAIHQADGYMTVNGGVISTPTYRSIRVNKGDLIINGGEFQGQVWLQPNQGNVTLKITGGIFAPTGNDGSSVFMTNAGEKYTVSSAEISGGVFTTKIGVSNPSALQGIIKGGQFSGTAKESTNSALIADGLTFGKYADDQYGVLKACAMVNQELYATLAEAFEAAQDGETITLLTDISLSETIKNTKKVTLDLNGKTITGKDNNTSGNFYLFDNRGELTVTGNGKITLIANNDRGTSASSVVIANNPGGKLVIENGTIEHLGGTYMAYAIDNLTNGKGTYAETVINGGTIKSTYRAIRQFLNGAEAQNILTINGGTIEGVNRAIFVHDPSKNANSGTITITENATVKGDIYFFVTEGSTEWPVEVSIVAAALNGEVTSKNIPFGYILKEKDGVWSVYEMYYVAQIGEDQYNTLQAAIDAALQKLDIGENVTILFLVDINENVTIMPFVDAEGNVLTEKKLIVDGADFTYTGKIIISSEANVTIQNVDFKNGGIAYLDTKIEDEEENDPEDDNTETENSEEETTVTDVSSETIETDAITERVAGIVTGGSFLYACLATNNMVTTYTKSKKRKDRSEN